MWCLSARAADITLTTPSQFTDGTPLPLERLVAIVYRVGEAEPIATVVGFPFERVKVSTPENYGTWYLTAWLIGTLMPSMNSEIVTKTPPSYDCGGCHS